MTLSRSSHPYPVVAFWMVLAIGTLAFASPARSQSGGLTIDSLLDIRHPSQPTWSSDGRRVAFVWDRAGTQNVWVVEIDSASPRRLTSYEEGLVGNLFWSRDGSRLFYEREGNLWQVPVEGGAPGLAWETENSASDARLSPDGKTVAFVREGDVWVRGLEEGRDTRLTETPAFESGIEWSPDGAHLAFSVSTATPQDESYDFVGAKIRFRRFARTLPDVGVAAVSGGPGRIVSSGPGEEGSPLWLDGKRLSLQRVSPDHKVREVLVVDIESGEEIVLHRDQDEKWWSIDYMGPEPKPSPDGRYVAFLSDRDGWDQLYVVSSSGGEIHALTRGQQEARRFAWSPDGGRIAFDTNEGNHPGRRHLAYAEIGEDPSRARIVKLTEGGGTNIQPTDRYGFRLDEPYGGWSPDGSRLVFQRTDPQNPADLYWLEIPREGEAPVPRRFTDSLPSTIDRSRLVEPELVWYPARDGQQVPAYLFVPPGLDRSQEHPAIVWIHGDGIAMNYDGWHIRRDYAVYYSFHQYLVQKGYVVLAPDYRGSVGYGRKWRQEPYLDVGGKDYEDVAAGATYLETLGFVDPSRIGVWGLSYGGFFTLQALTLDPELFACGINVAGVQDYRFWFRDPGGRWILGRMGTPDENPEPYLHAAPIERIDRIVRPLMILHGTADVNVPFLESVRLVDVLLKEGKDFDFMMYPGEYHYFHRGHVIRDAWQRVERFFAEHLRNGGARPLSP